MEEFDFIGPNDQPALVAITAPEPCQVVKAALTQMGYKVHIVDSHASFQTRYNQVNYQVVVVDENFEGATLADHATLRFIQSLPMAQRRYAVFFLVGSTVESLNALQAFGLSVHCVMNFAELGMFTDVVQKTIAENDLFLNTFREVQRRVYQKGT